MPALLAAEKLKPDMPRTAETGHDRLVLRRHGEDIEIFWTWCAVVNSNHENIIGVVPRGRLLVIPTYEISQSAQRKRDRAHCASKEDMSWTGNKD